MTTFSVSRLANDDATRFVELSAARATQDAAEAPDEQSGCNLSRAAAAIAAVALGVLMVGVALLAMPIVPAIIVSSVGGVVALAGVIALFSSCGGGRSGDVIVVNHEAPAPRSWFPLHVPFFYPTPRPVVVGHTPHHTPHAGHRPAPFIPGRPGHVAVGAGHFPPYVPPRPDSPYVPGRPGHVAVGGGHFRR